MPTINFFIRSEDELNWNKYEVAGLAGKMITFQLGGHELGIVPNFEGYLNSIEFRIEERAYAIDPLIATGNGEI